MRVVTSLFQKLCCSFVIEGWSWNSLMWLTPRPTCLSLHLQPVLHEPLSMGPGHACPGTHWASQLFVSLLRQLPLSGFPILISNLILGEPLKLSDVPGRCITPSFVLLWSAGPRTNVEREHVHACSLKNKVCHCYGQLPSVSNSLQAPHDLLTSQVCNW